MTQSCNRDIGNLVASHLIERLDSCLTSDMNKARHIAEPFCHSEVQHLFRALAEASNRTGSRVIGEILATFFITRASTYITASESSLFLGQWLFAIVRANMSDHYRRECFHLVMRERPDLSIKLAGRGWKADKVIEHLEWAGVHTSARGGDLLALDFPGYSLRDRGCLRGGQGLMGGGMLGGGLLSSLEGFGGLDRGGEDFSLERLVLAQEDAAKQGRRMLQLTLGRRYADRFDRPGAMDLGFGGGLASGRGRRMMYPEESEI